MKRFRNEYKTDKGKIFVITSKGKAECKSMASYEVGKPWGSNDQWSPAWAIDSGYLIEINDPDWVILPGYRAVYNNGKYVLSAGNHVVFHDKTMAEAEAKGFNERPWRTESDPKAYVVETTYEGKRPRACREFDGRTVYNSDYWIYERPIGSLVEEEVIDDMINCLPPACMRSSCMQCGEPHSTRIDKNGNARSTYATFKMVAKGVYEYCGYCFRGENVERGSEIPVVA